MPFNDDDEPGDTVDAIVAQFLGLTPFDDPAACREILSIYSQYMEAFFKRKERRTGK